MTSPPYAPPEAVPAYVLTVQYLTVDECRVLPEDLVQVERYRRRGKSTKAGPPEVPTWRRPPAGGDFAGPCPASLVYRTREEAEVALEPHRRRRLGELQATAARYRARLDKVRERISTLLGGDRRTHGKD